MSRRAHYFLEITLDSSTLRWWTGEGDITFDSQTYTGLGTRFIPPERVKRSAGLKSQKITLEFDSSRQSDNSDPIGALLDEKWRRRAVRLRRVAWAYGETPDDGDVLIDERGRIQNLSDAIQQDEQPIISMEIESGSLAYLERRPSKRTSVSQKEAFPDDKGFDLAIQHQGTKLIWGKTYADVEIIAPDNGPVSRKWCLGRFVTEGSLAAHFAPPGPYSQHWYLYRIIPIADHRVGSVDFLEVNGERVISSPLVHGQRRLTRIPGDKNESRFWVTFYDGRPSQNVHSFDSSSVPSEWTSAHRLRGVACIVVCHRWDDDIAQEFTYRIGGQGAYLYDRRKDSTAGGSGTHRWDNPSTWELSTNAMVAFDHYRMGVIARFGYPTMWFGVGEAAENFPYAEFKELADLCDENVTLKAGGTQKRYEVNGVISSDKSHKENLEALAKQMAAQVIDQGGRLAIRPPVERTPVATITDDDLVRGAPTQADPAGRLDDMVNTLEGNFTDPANDYKPNEYPKVSNATYVDDDNGEISDSHDLPLENSAERAQRLATLEIGKSRRIFELTETYGVGARLIEPGEWFNRESALRGFSSGKLFIADEVQKNLDGSRTVTSFEVDPTDLVWDENNAATIEAPPAFPQLELPPLDPPDVTITAVELESGSSKIPGFKFEFNLPEEDGPLIDYHDVEFGVGSDPDGITGEAFRWRNDGRDPDLTLSGFLPNTSYAFRFRSVRGRRLGEWSTDVEDGDWQYVTSTENATSTSAGVVEWSNVGDGDGTKPDDNADVTGDNTAAGFFDQGLLATLNGLPASLLFNFDSSNLLRDSEFSDPDFWSLPNDAALITDHPLLATAYLGAASAATSGVGSGNAISFTNISQLTTTAQLTPIEPGVRYHFRVEVGLTSGFTGYNQLRARWFDKDGVAIGSAVTIASGPDYRSEASAEIETLTLQGALNAPAGAAFVGVIFLTFWSSSIPNAGEAIFVRPRVRRNYSLKDFITLEDGLTPATNSLLQTGLGIAAGFIDQGLLATLSNLFFGDGFLTETDGGSPATLNNFKTLLGIAAGFSDQGELATRGFVKLGDGSMRAAAGTTLTNELVVTSQGTAAAIAGQGLLATLNGLDYTDPELTGFGLIAQFDSLALESGYLTRSDGSTSLTENLVITSLGTASALLGQGALATLNTLDYSDPELTGFGSLAPRDSVKLGDGSVRAEAGTTLTNALVVTSQGIAGGISGQSPFATQQTIDFSDPNLTGFGALAALSGLAFGDAELTGFGDLAGLSGLAFGDPQLTGFGAVAELNQLALESSYLTRADGTTSLSESLVVTNLGISAGFSDQGALATRNAVKLGDGSMRTEGNSTLTNALVITSQGIAGGIAGQSPFATQQTIDYSDPNLTGFGGLAALSSLALGDPELTGFGTLAPRDSVKLGDGSVRAEAGSTLTNALVVTSQGTAAGIANQSPFATQQTIDRTDPNVTGFGDLAGLSGLAFGDAELTGFGLVAELNQVELGSQFIKRADGTTTVSESLVVTNLGVAAGFVGQGALTSEDALALGSGFLTGFGALAGLETLDFSDEELTGFGLVAQLDRVALGSEYITRADGTTELSESLVITTLGVAAGFEGQEWGATASEEAASNARVNIGQNMLVDTGFRFPSAYWTNTYNNTGLSVANSQTEENGIRIYQRTFTGTPSNGQFNLGQSAAADLPVQPGDRVEASIYTASTAGVTGTVGIQWLTPGGSHIMFSTGTVEAIGGSFDSGVASAKRHVHFATAPATAGRARIYGQFYAGYNANPVLKMAMPFLAHARADQTEPTPWSPGREAKIGADITGENTAAGFLNQGSLAVLNQVQLNTTQIKRADGTTVVSESLVVTNLGVASSITSQGSGATTNFYQQDSDPTPVANGSWWADTLNGQIKIRVSGSWVVVANFTTESAGSSTFRASSSHRARTWTGIGTGVKNTDNVTISVFNAPNGAAYAWTRISGHSSINVSSPTSNNPYFTMNVPSSGEYEAEFECRVTDEATGKIDLLSVRAIFNSGA